MIFKMDTTEVKIMASQISYSANRVESGVSSIHQTVANATWQSQARDEFVYDLELLKMTVQHTTDILRLMGRAADEKARQWEAIANFFNAPQIIMSGIWKELKSMFGEIWNRIKNSMRNFRFPSLPKFVWPSITALPIITPGIGKIKPPWNVKPLPFNRGNKPPFPLPSPNQPPPPAPKPAPNPPEIKHIFGNVDEAWPSNYEPPKSPIEKIEKIQDLNQSLAELEEKMRQYPDNKSLKEMHERLQNIKLGLMPQPVPLEPEPTGPQSTYSCATYAKAIRPDLGSTGHQNGYAYHYRVKFQDKAFNLGNYNGDLREAIAPGYAITWDPSVPNYNPEAGHVAIVTKVEEGMVWIAESTTWGTGRYHFNYRALKIDDLKKEGIWFIP